MAHSLGMSVMQPQPVVEDTIYDVVQLDISTPVAFPMPPVLVHTTKSAMDKPITEPISSRRLDHVYRLQEKDVEFILNHPKPNSMAVSSSARSKKTLATPNDKEGKKLDAMGQRFYSSGSLGVRTSTYLGLMGRYRYYLWDQLGTILSKLPEEERA